MNPNPLPLPNEKPVDFAAVESPASAMWNIGAEHGKSLLAEIEREQRLQRNREDDETRGDYQPEPRHARYLDLSGCCEEGDIEP